MLAIPSYVTIPRFISPARVLNPTRGPRKKYGNRFDYGQLPEHFHKSSVVEDNLRINIYQMSLRHKKFAKLLNVVVIVKTNLKILKSVHVLLFSSDLALAWNDLMDYYSLPNRVQLS
ncbi:hypothetical protein CCP3SC1_190014 [Gammaproteobacteria bacterium]